LHDQEPRRRHRPGAVDLPAGRRRSRRPDVGGGLRRAGRREVHRRAARRPGARRLGDGRLGEDVPSVVGEHGQPVHADGAEQRQRQRDGLEAVRVHGEKLEAQRLRVQATRTYLELTSPRDFRPAFGDFTAVTVAREPRPTPDLYRACYRTVGEAYHWRDRWDWSDAEIRRHLADPAISLHVARRDGHLHGWYELAPVG